MMRRRRSLPGDSQGLTIGKEPSRIEILVEGTPSTRWEAREVVSVAANTSMPNRAVSKVLERLFWA